LIHLAVAKMAQGDYAGGRAAQRESAAIRRELGNREGGPLSLTILGQIARLEGEASEARACFSEAVRLFRDLGGERRYLSWTLDGVAGTAAEEGRWARAARLFGAATAARAAVGDAAVPVLADRSEHDLARARAALGQSFAAAWSEGRAMTLEQAITHALEEAPEERAAAQPGSGTTTDRQRP
jgi:tetratricopeptide (TPR) repeat protein